MLSLLHIENIALIESADLLFGPGFNVLTGETGAGKSIVIDSISAVMGERTSRDLIRTGAKSALVSAVFCDLPPLPWFEETGISPDENGELIVNRQIQWDGKNLCRVAGKICTVSQLKALGSQLINIHGQHDGQQLLDERYHLFYLDSFGGLEEDREDYRRAYDAMTALQREMAALHMDEAEKSRRIDTLQYQISELERAGLRPGEEEELSERRTVLRNAGKLVDAVEEAFAALTGDTDSDGAAGLLSQAESALRGVSRLSETLSRLSEQLTDLRCTAEDLAEQLREARDRFDGSPEELDQVESRLDVLYRLKKKYGASEEEMLRYLDRCRLELDEIQMSGDTIVRLEKKWNAAREAAEQKAKLLSQKRRKAAGLLTRRIETELSQLDMPKVRFLVSFGQEAEKIMLNETGLDQVQFFMSANLGEEVKPIQKVASGGELARIMLALKNVLAENDSISTLIFDEVDTGVSGRAAQKVAEKMASVSRAKQVLCVTHLPQIAAMADLHFSVEKGESNGRTYTEVKKLDRPDRKEELARLTGGPHLSKAMLDGAEELLQWAEDTKKTK